MALPATLPALPSLRSFSCPALQVWTLRILPYCASEHAKLQQWLSPPWLWLGLWLGFAPSGREITRKGPGPPLWTPPGWTSGFQENASPKFFSLEMLVGLEVTLWSRWKEAAQISERAPEWQGGGVGRSGEPYKVYLGRVGCPDFQPPHPIWIAPPHPAREPFPSAPLPERAPRLSAARPHALLPAVCSNPPHLRIASILP